MAERCVHQVNMTLPLNTPTAFYKYCPFIIIFPSSLRHYISSTKPIISINLIVTLDIGHSIYPCRCYYFYCYILVVRHPPLFLTYPNVLIYQQLTHRPITTGHLMVAVAAKEFSVPVVGVAGAFMLTPLFAHNQVLSDIL